MSGSGFGRNLTPPVFRLKAETTAIRDADAGQNIDAAAIRVTMRMRLL